MDPRSTQLDTAPYSTEEQFNSVQSQLNSINLEIGKLAIMAQLLKLNVESKQAKPDHHQKSLEKADTFREQGNNAYLRSKDYEKALLFYTHSLAFAPPLSQAYASAHANRSAVLKDMSLFLESIAECQRALKANHVDQLIYKLHIRQGKCYKKLGERGKAVKCYKLAIQSLEQHVVDIDLQEKEKKKIELEIETCGRKVKEEPLEDLTLDSSIGVPDFPDLPILLSKCKNSEIPAAANCLSLRYNKQFGRHFVATRDILPGEVLMIEEPFAAVLDTNCYFSHCNHCLKRSSILLPCNNCAWAMFCSDACIEASRQWHQHECAIIPDVHAYLEAFLIKLCARIVLTAGSVNLIKYFDELRQVDTNKFKTNDEYRREGFNERGKYISSEVKTVGNLCYHGFEGSNKIELHNCLASVIMELFQFNSVPFKDDLLKFLSKFLMSYFSNVTFVFEHHINKKDSSQIGVPLACAIYPVYALLNHSCFPNTVMNFYGKTLVVRALRSIFKGEQVFTSIYSIHYPDYAKSVRQEILHEALFNCHCIVCDNKWPVLSELPAFPSFSCDAKGRKDKVKYDCSLNKLLLTVRGNKKWNITRDNVSLYNKHLAVLDKAGTIKNQHYMGMITYLREYYFTCGNFVPKKGGAI